MGYCVETTDVKVMIPAENLEEAYKLMCELNEHNELKLGGSWNRGGQVGWHFSWMDENYPETCADAYEVLEALGFSAYFDGDGDLYLRNYEGEKMGQEDLFFEKIAHLIGAGSYVEWLGEDGERWKWLFDGSAMETKYGKVVYD